MSALPRWFRFALIGMCTVLIVPFVIVKTGVGRGAVAATLAGAGSLLEPIVRTELALPERFAIEPDGAYAINGMPVEYHTYAVGESASAVVRKFHDGFVAAGYEQKIVDGGGAPMLVAIHPETAMMITVRLVRDVAGTPGVRLTQQDLSKFDPDYAATIPGLPVYPGASQRIVVSSLEGPPSQSISYVASGSPAMIEQFYRAEMRSAGWKHLEAPVRMPEGAPLPLFFDQGKLESSVLIVPQERSSATFVMLTLTGDPEDLS